MEGFLSVSYISRRKDGPGNVVTCEVKLNADNNLKITSLKINAACSSWAKRSNVSATATTVGKLDLATAAGRFQITSDRCGTGT
jgi:hypothetical protein